MLEKKCTKHCASPTQDAFEEAHVLHLACLRLLLESTDGIKFLISFESQFWQPSQAGTTNCLRTSSNWCSCSRVIEEETLFKFLLFLRRLDPKIKIMSSFRSNLKRHFRKHFLESDQFQFSSIGRDSFGGETRRSRATLLVKDLLKSHTLKPRLVLIPTLVFLFVSLVFSCRVTCGFVSYKHGLCPNTRIRLFLTVS